MARDNFEKCLDVVLSHEGGYVNDKNDPGGETNMGISKRSYPNENIKGMTRKRAAEIYKRDFWDAVRGDNLPAGVDLAVFDAAVNSGPSRAVKWLQRAVEVPQDGKIGPVTMGALVGMPADQVISRIAVHRLAFVQQLGTWGRFGGGWTRRIDDVRMKAIEMTAAEDRKDWLAELIETLVGLWKK